MPFSITFSIPVRHAIVVPQLSASALLVRAATRLNASPRESLGAWDFLRDEPGQAFEVGMLTVEGFARITAKGVRERLRKEGGYLGSAAALLAWIADGDATEGWYGTIPDEAGLFSYGEPDTGHYPYIDGMAPGELGLRSMMDDLMEFEEERKFFLGFRPKA